MRNQWVLFIAVLLGLVSFVSAQSTAFNTVQIAVPQADSAALGHEVLRANKVKLHPQNCGSNITRTTFATNGTATGVYPGLFSASGVWGIRSTSPAWYFSEGFTITSPPYDISGSIFQRRNGEPTVLWCGSFFRTAHFPYTATVTKQGKLVKRISGTATVFKIDNGAFHERLDQ
jgi:hypothetical protein